MLAAGADPDLSISFDLVNSVAIQNCRAHDRGRIPAGRGDFDAALQVGRTTLVMFHFSKLVPLVLELA